MSAKGPTKLFLGLALAVALDTTVQMLWKIGVTRAADGQTAWRTALALLRQPLFLAVGTLMVGQYLNWMTVLAQTELSYAHSFTSLSYVTVALCSALLLGEHLDPVQLLGIGFIMAGVWFVGTNGRSLKRMRAGEA